MTVAAPETRTDQVSVKGVRSPVLEAGDSAATEAVLMVHGNPGPAKDWSFGILSISQFARVVAPDMPGYGSADRPRDLPYTIQGYANHLAGIVEQLGLERVHLVLHDLGGVWGLQWALDHPDAFASVSLINTGVAPDYRWHKYGKVWRTPVIGEMFQLTSTRTALRIVLNHDNPKPFPKEFTDGVYEYADWGFKRAVLKFYRATDLAEWSARSIPRLLELARPALVIWGEDDKFLPLALAQRQRDAFPVPEIVAIPGAGHWPFIDDPESVRQPLVTFLTEQVSKPAVNEPATSTETA